MVRLFVPEGEGQHPLAHHRPNGFATQPSIITSLKNTIGAAVGINGFLALAGRSRPGTFLKLTATIGVFNLSCTAFYLYGRRELNRAIFKLDNISPKPGRLWDKSQHKTVEDFTLSGSMLGFLAALHPRAFPGASGWKRLVGATITAASLSSLIGETVLHAGSRDLVTLVRGAERRTRLTEYARLGRDEEAKAALPLMGRLVLHMYTSPALHFFTNPAEVFGKASQTTNQSGSQAQGAIGSDLHTLQKFQNSIHYIIELPREVEAGPDIEGIHRAYKDRPNSRDGNALNEWLENLSQVKQQIQLDVQYLWQELANKEKRFYDLGEETDEKDQVRYEMQLLNSMIHQFAARSALLACHIADARKQLDQMEHDTWLRSTYTPSLSALGTDIAMLEMDQHSPSYTKDELRTIWMRLKEIFAQMDKFAASYNAIKGHMAAHSSMRDDHVREVMENVTKRMEAAERLLRQFEDKTQAADARAQQGSESNKDG